MSRLYRSACRLAGAAALLAAGAQAEEDYRLHAGLEASLLSLHNLKETCAAAGITATCDEDVWAVSAQAEAELGNDVAVELFYLLSKDAELRQPKWQEEEGGAAKPDLVAELGYESLGFAVTRRMALSPSLFAFGRIGGHWWKQKLDSNLPAAEALFRKDGTDMLFGAGIEHTRPSLAFEAGYDYMVTEDVKLGVAYVGLSYGF